MPEYVDKKKLTCPVCRRGKLVFSDETVSASDDDEPESLELTCENCHREYVWI